MAKKQLLALFFCNLIIWTLGNGLLPLLPVYATTLGATPAITGYYMAASYLAMAMGTIVAGPLAEKLGRHKQLLVMVGLVCSPAIGLMGQASSVAELVLWTTLVWFFIGVIVVLLNILAGLSVRPAERGKIFGLIFLSIPLGALIGGATLGALVDWGGYATMFLLASVGWLGLPGCSIFFLTNPQLLPSLSTPSQVDASPFVFTRSFALIFLATILSAITIFVGRLGNSLSMEQLRFTSTIISSTAAVGGLVALPLIPLLGFLSDRFGRRGLLILLYLIAAVGVFMLSWATTVWHFWLAASLLSVSAYGNNTLSTALVGDLLPLKALNRGLSLLSSTTWGAGIMGFASTGYLLQSWGPMIVFTGAACLSLLAGLLLLSVRSTREEALSQPISNSQLVR